MCWHCTGMSPKYQAIRIMLSLYLTWHDVLNYKRSNHCIVLTSWKGCDHTFKFRTFKFEAKNCPTLYWQPECCKINSIDFCLQIYADAGLTSPIGNGFCGAVYANSTNVTFTSSRELAVKFTSNKMEQTIGFLASYSISTLPNAGILINSYCKTLNFSRV